MSGHNKWSKIKHKKAAEDSKKSKVFSILARQIALESKAAGGDKNSPRLRTIIEKARKANMPSDNIDRAVAKGAGTGGETYESFLYEGYGPGGAALVIVGITDSKNRSSQEIKHLFSEKGFSLGTPGSVTWAFVREQNEEGDFVWNPTQPLDISPEDQAKLEDLIGALLDRDDVEDVFTNAS